MFTNLLKSNKQCFLTIPAADNANINAVKMCIKLFGMMISVILLSIFSLVKCDLEEIFAPDQMSKMRCTLRFSPGVCVDNVEPVWTFVFSQQNCTERLGCLNNLRTNRFRSYRMCMKKCHALINMYLKIVELEERHTESKNTDDRSLRGGFGKYALGSQKDMPFTLEDPDEDYDEEEYQEDEEETRFIVYKYGNVNEDIMNVDIDKVPGEILTLIE